MNCLQTQIQAVSSYYFTKETHPSRLRFAKKNMLVSFLYRLQIPHVGRVGFIEQIRQEMSSHRHFLPGTHTHENLEDSGDEY